MKSLQCKYQCQTCLFEWDGYRDLYHRCIGVGMGRCVPYPCPRNLTKYPRRPAPGPTECPMCAEIYITWTNAAEVLKSMGEYWKEG